MFFRDIIGQKDVIASLLRQVEEGRVPHAIMFNGPSGCGKLPVALAFARYLLCENPDGHDACGKCRSCMMLSNKYEHPDLHFAFPITRRSGANSVCDEYLGEWRNFITAHPYFSYQSWLDEIKAGNSQAVIYSNESEEILRKLSFKSAMGGYKILIIWLPEKMHEVCANKLLKLIEEPMGKTCIMLVTENLEDVLGTIRSRAQLIPMRPIETDVLASVLSEKYGLSNEQSVEIARISNGDFVRCIKNIEVDNDSGFYFDMFVRLMRISYQRNVRDMKEWSEAMAEIGREKQKAFFAYSQHMLRESFMYNFHMNDIIYMSDRERNFAVRFAPFINENNVISIMDKMSLAASQIEANTNAKMVFFDFALQMIVEIAVRGARRE